MSAVAPTAVFNPVRLAQARAWTRYFNLARLAGFVAVLCTPFALWTLFWSSPQDYPFLSSLLYVPLTTYGFVLLFKRLWRGDRFVKLLFGGAIAARVVAAGAYFWVGLFVYGGNIDALDYWTVGLQRMQQFSEAGWAAFPPPYSSTNAVYNLCGLIMLVTGNALPTLFVIFALVALLGAYLFYRAFCLAFPHGNRGLYGLLVVFLPSILFWSSGVSKDSLTQLFIGISAYGFARLLRKLNFWTILICVIGMAGTSVIRPHIGAMLAASIIPPFALSLTRGRLMTTAAKILLLPGLVAGTLFMVSLASTFVGMEGTEFQSGIQTLDHQNKETKIGGSSFSGGQSLTVRVFEGPLLLFRPFPWEVHNVMSGFSAIEGMALLILFWGKRRECWALVREWREPYVAFVLLFALLFFFIFGAASSNFGIVARQRVMLLPIMLMLLCAKLPVGGVVASRAARQDSCFGTRAPTPTVRLVIP